MIPNPLKIKAIREDYFTVWVVGYDSDGEFRVVGEFASEGEALDYLNQRSV